MKVIHSAATLKRDENTLITIFVDQANQSQVHDLIKNELKIDFKLDEKFAEDEKKQRYNDGTLSVLFLGISENKISREEKVRKGVHQAIIEGNETNRSNIAIWYGGIEGDKGSIVTAMSESSVLSNYQFLTYKSDKNENSLTTCQIHSGIDGATEAVANGQSIGEATCAARDLVNEPVITLTAEELAKRAEAFGKELGFSVEVLNKSRIQSLKMGGLLAVNFGSPDPPTFSILEWKPENATNSKPIILVGKGVVYDTGGLSLKPTPSSMDLMKSDMGGAAAVIGAFCGIAKLGLPLHVIGLIPATDNRPGQNAYTPGDVITMFDGSTVEVLNTDAEGRMILADALAYAKKYDPELVIDLATLTGAAVVAVGTIGIAMMATAEEKMLSQMKVAGQAAYERVVELPLWPEYEELIKSDIADRKNIGGRWAGTITAGKFLEHFTDYPWIHLDIAGPAFLTSPDSYRGKNGTGAGVRLLLEFLQNYSA